MAISCPSAQACVAVGSYSPQGDATAERPLVESLHNGSFALGTAPVARGTNAILCDVSCASATSCVAVGQSSLTATRSAPLVERWQGSTWTSTPGATAAGSSAGALVSVSCPTGAVCVAVGWEAQATTLPETPLVNRLAAGKVSALAVPSSPVAFSAALCATETQCTAVGSAGADPYIGRFSGSNWVASASPSP